MVEETDLAVIDRWCDDEASTAYVDAPGWAKNVLKVAANNPEHHFLIAYEGDVPVGVIWLREREDGALWRISRANEPGTVYFERVVAPEHRGRGIGRALLIAAANTPSLRHVQCYAGEVHKDNSVCKHSLLGSGFTISSDEVTQENHDHVRCAREVLVALGNTHGN
jgi:GNAT superfamily N-acetyltransferase